VVWAYIGWLKFREHHHLIQHHRQHYHETGHLLYTRKLGGRQRISNRKAGTADGDAGSEGRPLTTNYRSRS
jgi:hypothetical protein